MQWVDALENEVNTHKARVAELERLLALCRCSGRLDQLDEPAFGESCTEDGIMAHEPHTR
jgi:hypothetical protein